LFNCSGNCKIKEIFGKFDKTLKNTASADVNGDRDLEDRCASYWNRYLIALSDNIDGFLLFEKANLSVFRKSWLNKEFSIVGLYRSKIFVPQYSVLEKILMWLSSIPLNSSVPHYELHDLELLQLFPESFT
jgi:hypothetical protein